MLITIPGIFTKSEARQIRQELEKAEWIDGGVTAGHQSIRVKRNRQLREDDPLAREIGDLILARLSQNELFVSAALPLRVFPPLFNRYEGGETFGNHIDNAIRVSADGSSRIRTDLSATLFLTEPQDYEGGELLVDTVFGVQSVKLDAGSMVLYPASSLHRVNPVTRGARISSFFWIQSMVRDDNCRTILFDLDSAIRELSQLPEGDSTSVKLTGIYHNLLRRWADI
jgi:PKHD-type hydroxylase